MGRLLFLQVISTPSQPCPPVGFLFFANPFADGARFDCSNFGANIAGLEFDVFPVESQDSMSAPPIELEKNEEAGLIKDGQRFEVCSEATSGWTRRCVLFPPQIMLHFASV